MSIRIAKPAIYGALCVYLVGLAAFAASDPAPRAPETQAQPRQAGPLIPVNPPTPLSGGHIAYIPIEGAIDTYTLPFLRQRVEAAKAAQPQPSTIVFEINTPGGHMMQAIQIARYIKSDVGVMTVAWVNDNAYSAGSLIATACDRIVMAPASVIGDCAPIAVGTFGQALTLGPVERAKALAPLLTEFRDNAAQNGYEYAMLHAMCVPGTKLYVVEERDTSLRRVVTQADYYVMVEGDSIDEANEKTWDFFDRQFGNAPVNSAPAFPLPGAAGTQAPPNLPNVNPISGAQRDGRFVPGAPVVWIADDKDRGQWDLVARIHDAVSQPLTLSQDEAVNYGLAQSSQIRTEADLQQLLNAQAGAKSRYNITWSMTIGKFLTNPWVRALLILTMIVAGYIEAQSPGASIPGIIALAALLLLVVAPYVVGIAQWWHLAVLIIGIILIALEIFVVPGFGITGVSGVICVFVGLVLMIVPSSGGGAVPLPGGASMDQMRRSVISTLGGLIAAMIALFVLVRHFKDIPVLNRLILSTQQEALTDPGTGDVNVARPPQGAVSGGESVGEGQLRVGQDGVVTSGLRPTGRARFGEHVVDVVSPGQWIQTGERVTIIEVHGNRIVVTETT